MAQTVKQAQALPRVRLANIAAKDEKDLQIFSTGVDWYDGGSKQYRSTHRGIGRVLKDADSKDRHTNDINLWETGPKFKYLLDVDGVTVSWRGYQLLGAQS